MDELSKPAKSALHVWLWVGLGVVVLLVVAGAVTQFFGTDVTFGLRSQVNAPGFTDEEVAAVPSSEITFVEPEFPVVQDTFGPVAEETALPAPVDDTSLLSPSDSPIPTDVPTQTSVEPLQPELPISDPEAQSSAAPEAVVSTEPVVEENMVIGDFSDQKKALEKSADFIESALNKVVGVNAYTIRIQLRGMTKQEIVCGNLSLVNQQGDIVPISWVGAAPDFLTTPCS